MKPKSWATLFQEESLKSVREPAGKGWLTMTEVCKAMGCGRSTARKVVRDAIKDGRCEVFNGSQITSGNHKSKATWYRLRA